MNNLLNGAKRGGILAVVALLFGVIVGWIGVATTEGTQALAATSGGFFTVLVVLLPLTLALTGAMNIMDIPLSEYSATSLRVEFSVAGFVGALGGSFIFTIAIFQIAAVFGGIDPPTMIDALRPYLFNNLPLVLGVTTLSGLLIAQWVYLKNNG